MENFNTYEQVINALKAEYVNARNLKRVANTARRATKNAASFKNRKENEKTTLENRVDSIETSLNSTLSNAISQADEKKWTDLKSKLSELKGKLEHIENEEYLLVRSFDVAPWDYSEVSDIDSNSFTMLKNLLTTAISDAEIAINDAYGSDYHNIQQATTPLSEDNSKFTNSEIISKFNDSKATLNELFQKATDAITEYTVDMIDKASDVKQLFEILVDKSIDLSIYKEELANYLVTGATQNQIDDVELNIADTKEAMINRALELKLANEKLIEWTVAKFNIVAEYIEDARDYANGDYYNIIANNSRLLRDVQEGFGEYIDYKVSTFYNSLFDALVQLSHIPNPTGSENEFIRMKYNLEDIRLSHFEIVDVHNKYAEREYMLEYPLQALTTINERGNLELQQNINQSDVNFYFDYSQSLHQITKGYIDEKVTRNFKKGRIADLCEKYNQYLFNLNTASNMVWDAKYQLRLANKSHLANTEVYTGTPEQELAYQNFISENNQFEYLYHTAESEYMYQEKSFSLFTTLYEQEFTTLNNLLDTQTAAHDYLLTLTESDAAYPEADAAYNNASIALDIFLQARHREDLYGFNNLSCSGAQLLAFKDSRDNAYNDFEQAQQNLDNAWQEFNLLKSQMTYSEPSIVAKKQGLGSDISVSKAGDRVNNAQGLRSSLEIVFSNIRAELNVIKNHLTQVTDEQFAQFEQNQLNMIKDFLDNVSNNNLLYMAKRDNLAAYAQKENLNNRLSEYSGFDTSYIPNNQHIFSPQVGNQLNSFVDSQLRSTYPSALMNIINIKALRFNPDSFADSIIDEANNGTPLVS